MMMVWGHYDGVSWSDVLVTGAMTQPSSALTDSDSGARPRSQLSLPGAHNSGASLAWHWGLLLSNYQALTVSTLYITAALRARALQ